MSGQTVTKKISLPSTGENVHFPPARYVVGAMCFGGIMIQYTLKVLLSVAIVAMVKTESHLSNNSQMHSDIFKRTDSNEELDVCTVGESNTSSESQEGEFEWDEKIQGHILSAYYYGYIATQLLAGRLSELIGCKFVLGPGIFLAGLATVLGPVAARINVGVFIASRVIAGAASGFIIPAVYVVMAKWFIPDERLFIGAVITAGVPVGTIISMTLSGVLANAGGWPLVFYFFGGIALFFFIPWTLLAYSSPDQHPRISEQEKNFILKGTAYSEENKETHKVPWLAIMLSGPFWAHIAMGIGYLWVGYTLMSDMPTYLSKILNFNLQDTGIISALPYVAMGTAAIVGSYLSQWLCLNGYLSKLTCYNIFNMLAGCGSGIALLLVTFVGCDSTATVILLVMALGMSGLYQGGSYINHIDLGSNFTGTLSGIHLTLLNSMGIVAPTVVGYIIDGKQTLSQWKIVFYVATAIPAACSTLYLLFGSVEEQPWNKISEKPKQLKPV